MKKKLTVVPTVSAAEQAENKIRRRILFSNIAAVSVVASVIAILVALVFDSFLEEILPGRQTSMFLTGFTVWLALFLLFCVDTSLFERRRSLGWSWSLPGLVLTSLIGVAAYTLILKKPVQENFHLIAQMENIDFFLYGIPGLVCIGAIAIVLWNRQGGVNTLESKNSWVVGYTEPPVNDSL